MQENHAVIVIDMQADYIGKKSKKQIYPTSLIEKINRRIQIAVEEKSLIVYVRNTGRKNKMPYVSGFADGLDVKSNHIVNKERASIFSNDSFVDLLKENQIKTVECIGIDGNCCVATSAIETAKLGYSAIIPLELIGTKDESRFEKTKVKLKKANVQIVE